MTKIRPLDMRDEVKHEAFEAMLVKANNEPAFIISLHERNKLRAYVVKTIYNTANFPNSKHNRQLRRRTEIPTEAIEDRPDDSEPYDYEALVQDCAVKTEAIYWYNRDILKLYAELGSLRAVSEKTGIPRSSVCDAVLKARAAIKQLLWE